MTHVNLQKLSSPWFIFVDLFSTGEKASIVHRLTLKWTWMWSRRTSTRKNLRAQISQVYFLSPWVNRCLFMLLLQENTCAHKCHWWSTSGQISKNLTCCHSSLLLFRGLTLPQIGQGDGSFLYLVPSSPLASSSSLFMCFGPVQMHQSFSSAKSLRWSMVTWNSSVF